MMNADPSGYVIQEAFWVLSIGSAIKTGLDIGAICYDNAMMSGNFNSNTAFIQGAIFGFLTSFGISALLNFVIPTGKLGGGYQLLIEATKFEAGNILTKQLTLSFNPAIYPVSIALNAANNNSGHYYNTISSSTLIGQMLTDMGVGSQYYNHFVAMGNDLMYSHVLMETWTKYYYGGYGR